MWRKANFLSFLHLEVVRKPKNIVSLCRVVCLSCQVKKQYLNSFRIIFSEMAAIMQGQLFLVHFWRCTIVDLSNLMAWMDVLPGLCLLKTFGAGWINGRIRNTKRVRIWVTGFSREQPCQKTVRLPGLKSIYFMFTSLLYCYIFVPAFSFCK